MLLGHKVRYRFEKFSGITDFFLNSKPECEADSNETKQNQKVKAYF
jgi:hypothetical protein